MRVADIHLRTAAAISLLLAGSACQTAQKPVALLPATTVPSLHAAAPGTAHASGPNPTQDANQAQTSASEQPKEAPAKSIANPEPDSTQTAAPVARQTASDPVADLIGRAEQEYQTGLSEYRAGNTDAAKKDFDSAFNALLGSNLDIRSDERLEKEFDHLVEAVNELDLGGVAPDSEAQQKSEPAPIDETNGITPAADPNVKAKAQAEIKLTHSDLPLMMTDQVAGYISYFSNRGRGTFERALARSGRYHDMMVSVLRQEGVPQDLIYLAQAESGFHPLAVSRAGARGIWQFIGSRARGYGLSHSQWVDERQDPEKSTRAAARHLKDLYNQFGDWYLAMAAYNSGPGTVQAAVKRTGYADFWELYRRNVLPKETRNYVPIILAVTIMAKNPTQYGLEAVAMDRPAPYDSVTITYPVDLRLVAECVDATTAQLQDLNPSLLRLTTPREGSFELHLPSGTRDQYETAIGTIPSDMRLWWHYHTVRPGDTLASVAHTYRVTAKSIAETNHLDDSDGSLEADAKLVIPVAPGKHPLSDTATYARHITRYKVHRGDTVETVAENFGVPAQMVRRWNGLRGDSLRGRTVLAVHIPVAPGSVGAEVASSHSTPARHKTSTTQLAGSKAVVRNAEPKSKEENTRTIEASVVHHRVRLGETLYSIASSYQTTVAALKRDNRNVGVLRPGTILIIQPAR